MSRKFTSSRNWAYRENNWSVSFQKRWVKGGRYTLSAQHFNKQDHNTSDTWRWYVLPAKKDKTWLLWWFHLVNVWWIIKAYLMLPLIHHLWSFPGVLLFPYTYKKTKTTTTNECYSEQCVTVSFLNTIMLETGVGNFWVLGKAERRGLWNAAKRPLGWRRVMYVFVLYAVRGSVGAVEKSQAADNFVLFCCADQSVKAWKTHSDHLLI